MQKKMAKLIIKVVSFSRRCARHVRMFSYKPRPGPRLDTYTSALSMDSFPSIDLAKTNVNVSIFFLQAVCTAFSRMARG